MVDPHSHHVIPLPNLPLIEHRTFRSLLFEGPYSTFVHEKSFSMLQRLLLVFGLLISFATTTAAQGLQASRRAVAPLCLPYRVGAQISGGTIPVTSLSGALVSGLVVGRMYAIEATNGPWYASPNIATPQYGAWGSNDSANWDRLNSDPAATAQALREQTQEFWRCISLLPSVVGRQELIVGLVGLSVEVNLLTEVLVTGYGVVRDSGVKRLNPFLPDNLQQTLEDALAMQGLSGTSLVRAHLRLAEVMHAHGPVIADKHRYTYPAELEAVVLAYVQREVDLLGLERLVD